ncbi:MAG: signal peptide peptidase SppA [Thermodesulfobacteriota bacterium]|nr:signal peptide peptidase SppA [Thermodesulfobacteriota bacterium]
MKLLDIMTAPWMIAPEKLAEIRAIYQAHIRGDKIDIKAIEEQLAIAIGDKKERGEYDIINGVAIIPVKGVVSKRPSLFSFFFSRASTTDIAIMFKDALMNDEIEAILLDIDSPGGTVDGTQELAELIYSSRGQKPIIVYTDGMMASAAYYIGAAADKIYISGDMPDIGSIGVAMMHLDYSKSDEKYGFKETDIYAGKYKRITSGNKPLSEEGEAYLQDQVDYVYSIFVNDVAKYRGTTVDDVLKNMADGKIFIGRQALNAGLVDGVSTFDQLINTTLPVLQLAARETSWLEKLNMEAKNGFKRI